MGKKITILLLSLLLLASLGLAIKEIYSALHPTKDPEVIRSVRTTEGLLRKVTVLSRLVS